MTHLEKQQYHQSMVAIIALSTSAFKWLSSERSVQGLYATFCWRCVPMGNAAHLHTIKEYETVKQKPLSLS